ncbi:hypothetical protein SERLA73DRAFT_161888 [Serpula lacrymans var. lacrymans S7.3]|uniref:Diaminopimelate epimerase-like protein n=2 Tax=Serpula lacrymans var. lacrymans TaxID=341189 RepID=F8Q498_SERL3|nr:uncharacterized protein SERLADRAFT_416975 [Serpula lacrymans var. lacrymans S7.9]EGN96953.1 hypothetical protein SERLA73DRAFT_161888 [Serpula lacrymans var. lacrymans S7.3]EGO22548.1 hypothetical protein SERLADRAFT_416975 [Serpula lacrymans var. lacrymans S7.9]
MSVNNCRTPFVIVNAFSDDSFGGNPAVIVFLPQSSQTSIDISSSALQKIAHSFNQPIVVFVAPPSPDADDGILNVRFFTPELEAPLCGHGLLAATKAICDGYMPGQKHIKDILKFRNMNGTVLSAGILLNGAGAATQGEWFELELQDNVVEEVSPDEKQRLTQIVGKALGKSDVVVKFIGQGVGALDRYVLIVLDEKETLDGAKVDTEALKGTFPRVVNILTRATPNSDTVFVSRMFAPLAGLPEDPVCGTAHCLLTPYWSTKTHQEGQDLRVKQVSPRGGDLLVRWEKERGIVKLRGKAIVTTSGNLHL